MNRCDIQVQSKQVELLLLGVSSSVYLLGWKRLNRMGLTTNKASVFEDFFLVLFLTSQIGKSIDDNTKYEIKDDNNNDEEE